MPDFNPLTPEEERIIVRKGTEYPGTGEYLHNRAAGTYVCRRCGAALYRSNDKFDSGCGWPAFDDAIPGAVEERPDPDGRRTEILCRACGGHLGHVFAGEGFTPKDVRHCVNSLSMRFIPEGETSPEPSGQASETPSSKPPRAYFAAGCFWGVEYWFKRQPGVTSTRVGYMGGSLEQPTYRQVCSGATGHAETLEVVYDPARTSYEKLCRLFFEIHDFTQPDGQGPDLGDQYRSAVFFTDDRQEETAERILGELRGLGHAPVTEVTPAGVFWPAEEYHQDYYAKNGKSPYCHARRKIFPA